MTIGEGHGLEQRIESLLLAEEHSADVSGWADNVDTCVVKLCRNYFRVFHRVQVITNLNCSAANAAGGVRFFEMTAGVIDHVPIHAVLFDVIGQQNLREVS